MKKVQLKIFGLSVALIGVFLFSTGCSHKITGEFYFDLNKNGYKDFGEPNVPNVKIMITKDNVPWREGVTKADGTFTLTYTPNGKEEPVFALFVDQDYIKSSVLENPEVVAQISSAKNYSLKVTDFESDEMSDTENNKATKSSVSKASDSSSDDESDDTSDDTESTSEEGTTDTQTVDQTVDTPKGAVKAWKQKNAHLVVALNFDFSSSLDNVSTQEYKMFYKCPTAEKPEALCDPYNLKFYYPSECTPNDIIIPDIFKIDPNPNININQSTNVVSFPKSASASSTKASSTSSSSTTTSSGPLTASTTVAMQKISAQDLSFKIIPEKLGDAEKTYEIKLSATCFGKNLDLEPLKITVAKEKSSDEEKSKNYVISLRIDEKVKSINNPAIDNTEAINALCVPCVKVSKIIDGVTKTDSCPTSTSDIDWQAIDSNLKYQYRLFTINIKNLAETDVLDVEKGLLKVVIEDAPSGTTFIDVYDSPPRYAGDPTKTACNRDAMGMECVIEKLYSGAILIPSLQIKTPTRWTNKDAATLTVKATFKALSTTSSSSDENEQIIESTPYTISIEEKPDKCDKWCKDANGDPYCTVYPTN